MTDSPKGVFELGLVMAGAVSAGAYTAGVIDFLFQALDGWEAHRISDPENTPQHHVSIRVITGASAGAMTAGLIGSLVSRELKHIEQIDSNANNPLYEAWVNQIDITRLLQTSDLAGNKLESLLNSKVLDEIASHVFGGGTPRPRRSYFAEPLQLFVTLSSLLGIPYGVKMSGHASHGMRMHRDFMDFVIDGPGTRSLSSTVVNPECWRDLINAAVASGAFPIGLAPQSLARAGGDYASRVTGLPDNNGNCAAIAPDWDLKPTDRLSKRNTFIQVQVHQAFELFV